MRILNSVSKVTLSLTTAFYIGAPLASPQHQYIYDGLGRLSTHELVGFGLTTTHYLDTGSPGAKGQLYRTENSDGNVGFQYNVLGLPTQMQDLHGFTFFEYDTKNNLNKVIRSIDMIKGNTDDRVVEYSWDDAGGVTQQIYPNGETINYIYDNNTNRLSQIHNVTFNEIVSFNYSTVTGLPESITRSNNEYSLSFSYDDIGRLTGKTYQDGATTIAFEVQLDAIGQVEWLKKTSGGITAMEDYTFNDRNQLTKVVYSVDDNIDESVDVVANYSYDKAGKRTSLLETTAGVVSKHLTYQYNNTNQLELVTDVLNASPYATLTYDVAGNIATKVQNGQTYQYQWYKSGRLRQVDFPGTTIQFEYDGLGNRLSKSINGVKSEYVTDTMSGSVLQVYQGTSLVDSYSETGLSLNGQRRFVATDFVGSPRFLMTSSLSILDSEDYDVYGMPQGNGLNGARVHFAGEFFDQQSGLLYLNARYYDADLGIFISPDPAGFRGGTYLYGYAAANPVSTVDRNGMQPSRITNLSSGETIRNYLWQKDAPNRRVYLDVANQIYGNNQVSAPQFPARQITIPVTSTGRSIALDNTTGNGANLFYRLQNLAQQGNTPPLWLTLDLASVDPDSELMKGFRHAQNFFGVAQLYDQVQFILGVTATVVSPGNVNNSGRVTSSLIESGPGRQPSDYSVTGRHIGQNRNITPRGAGQGPGKNQTHNTNHGVQFTIGAPGGGNRVWYLPVSRSVSDQLNTQRNIRLVQPGYVPPVAPGIGPGPSRPTKGLVKSSKSFGSNDAGYFFHPTIRLGGVLLDGTAQLIGDNLSDIAGASYDPVTQDLIFLGNDGVAANAPVNMDYFHTAVKAVYGSAMPPTVSLDPAARPDSGCYTWGCASVVSDQDDQFESGEEEGFLFKYVPFWDQEDTSVDIRIRAREVADPTVVYDWTQQLLASPDCTIQAGGRCKMDLSAGSLTNAPAWLTVSQFVPYGGFSLGNKGQDSTYAIIFQNSAGPAVEIENVIVVPDRQHRRFGGRIENTRLGWVMYEADRLMKALAIGTEQLTGADYDSSTVAVTGYKNLIQRIQETGESNISARMWFTPNNLTIKRNLDADGHATMLFDASTVKLQTESSLFSGTSAGQAAEDFADHFTQYFDEFAAIEFPVQDPQTGSTIQVKIFDELKQVMEATALARFFNDNNIPLDMWWLNTYHIQSANIPKSINTASKELNQSGYFALVTGGAQWIKGNSYLAGDNTEAANVGFEVVDNRPVDIVGIAGEVIDDMQGAWNVQQGTNHYRAVSASFKSKEQANTQSLAETDLQFPSSAGALAFTRFHQSQIPVDEGAGEGWMLTPVRLLFSRPSWFDGEGLMKDAAGNSLPVTFENDTQLRSDQVLLYVAGSGAMLDFNSSLLVEYSAPDSQSFTIAVSGLTGEGGKVPSFVAGDYSNGAILTQRASDRHYILTDKLGGTLEFDPDGRLLQVTHSHGQSISYSYNPDGTLDAITDGSQSLILTYQNGELTQLSGPAGENVTYSYSDGALISATHVRSTETVTYQYDDDGRVVSRTDFSHRSDGLATFDTRGRAHVDQDVSGNRVETEFLISSLDGNRTTTNKDSTTGLEVSATEDMQDRLISATNENGLTSTWSYAGNAYLPEIITPAIPNTTHPGIEQQHDNNGLLTSVKNLGNSGALAQSYTYDQTTGLPLSATNEPGDLTTYSYKSIGTGPAVNLHTISFKGANETVATQVEEREYVLTGPNTGKLRWIKNSEGNKVVELDYYDNGQLKLETDAAGLTTNYTYDALGRLERVYPPEYTGVNDYIQYAYNDRDQVTSQSNSLGSMSYTYYVNGDLKTITNPLGQVTRYSYQPETGRVTTITRESALGDVISQYVYDRHGLMSLIDAEGFSERLTRNSLGQVVRLDWGRDFDADGLFDSEESAHNTDVNNPDSDGDGIPDGVEVNSHNSEPDNADADLDGLSDYDELYVYFTNPSNNDSDGDGVTDADEVNLYQTNPMIADTDGDGLSDFEEITSYSTDPIRSDTDGDGWTDYEELYQHNTDPLAADMDGDGLNDRIEVMVYQTNPNDADTDNDGKDDEWEIRQGFNPLISEGAVWHLIFGD